ncbi:MAG: hypothetical protein QME41_10145 [Actinomycetota bacterium]|nr:hypothetical protein [Actinomycetota bacterium]
MLEINDFQEQIELEFGGRVKVASYNIYYDDTEEVAPLVEKVWRERLQLPATFIDGELALEGLIDKTSISSKMKDRSR